MYESELVGSMAEYNVTVVGSVASPFTRPQYCDSNSMRRLVPDRFRRAGVIGLTSAVLLSRKPEYSVTVIAKHMPGDLDIEYTSPWAGAHYFP